MYGRYRVWSLSRLKSNAFVRQVFFNSNLYEIFYYFCVKEIKNCFNFKFFLFVIIGNHPKSQYKIEVGVKLNYIKMKKIISLLTMGLLLISCSSSSSNPATSGVYNWSFKLDGVPYQWQGTFQNPGNGGGTYTAINNKGMLTLSSNIDVSVGVQFPSVSTGDFTFNSSSPQSTSMTIIIKDPGITSSTYMTGLGGTMNVNISSLSSITQATNPTNPGTVIGTFSGTIRKGGGQIATVTDGSFEVARNQ